MQGLSLIFFFIFALILLLTYVALRRGWAHPGRVAGASILGCAIAMTLTLLAQPDVSPFQGIFFGILIGAGFAGATLAVAWYFQRSEMQRAVAHTSE